MPQVREETIISRPLPPHAAQKQAYYIIPFIMAEIAVGSYIFERLKQLGVKSIFGVPGGA